MEFKKVTLNDDNVVQQLIELSYIWEKEENTWGLRHNTKEDLQEPCFVALEGNRIIGYIFGHYYDNENYKAFANIGDKFFYVEELYVLPEYRNQGIGRKLFSLLEEEVKDKVTCITLSTATKDYEKILKFYAKDLNMTFNSAFLFKKTK